MNERQMTLQFESNLDYQTEAIESICGVFEGEETYQTLFSLTDNRGRIEQTGVGNDIRLGSEQLLANVQAVQLRNGLPQTTQQEFEEDGMNFSVEMETGTGKTYVYLKTIFELNRRYGFTKFIVVVPSIAIKEGTKKTLEITREHFMAAYENVVYDWFVFESTNLDQVRSFATSENVVIMVINIDAFRKTLESNGEEDKANIIHRYNDPLGCKPIDLIRETHPIVIIDEPQSVDNTPKSKEAIASLGPLCCLRYSATHKTPYNMMYRLDPLDAYERQLVKQIEVASVTVEGMQNDAYIHLLRVDNRDGIKAQVEVDVQSSGKVARKKLWVRQNDDLYRKTSREQYEGFIVEDIWKDGDRWHLSFTSNDKVVAEGQPIGSVGDDALKREQIRLTIETHLDKELRLNAKGIKVLSLFFIDKVANYRVYDAEGHRSLGKYGQMFEEEYNDLIRRPKYRSLQAQGVDVAQVHGGYFSVDKRSKASNKKDKYEAEVDTTGTSAKDDDTFNLIMRKKEELLSFASPMRFIFSHSALCEGWDNPNVFQICTLMETKSDLAKRQKIGRGLRICVNQDGQRIRGFEVNTLTVMANESFEDFTKSLQKEMEDEQGIKFGTLRRHTFARIAWTENGRTVYMGEEKSQQLFDYFVEKGYVEKVVIDKGTQETGGKVQDRLRLDLKDDRTDIPEAFLFARGEIIKMLRRVAGNYLNIKNARDRQPLRFRKQILLNTDFAALWEKIKYKTRYDVQIDTNKLIEQCAREIANNLQVGKGKFVRRKVTLQISEGGIAEQSSWRLDRDVNERMASLPDIVTYLQNETGLTRPTIVSILKRSGQLAAFKKNPQAFMEFVLDAILREKREMLVDGIHYHKIDDVWCQELFESEELQGYLNSNLVAADRDKSPYDYVLCDSEIEMTMAKRLEDSPKVKVYAKLPSWFKIDTPLGTYNPDWVLVWEEEDGEPKLFFAVETKGKNILKELSLSEQLKIRCGEQHFADLDTGVKMLAPVKDFDAMERRIG